MRSRVDGWLVRISRSFGTTACAKLTDELRGGRPTGEPTNKRVSWVGFWGTECKTGCTRLGCGGDARSKPQLWGLQKQPRDGGMDFVYR